MTESAKKSLAAQVVARQAFIEETLKFVTSVTNKRGKVLKHETHNWHMYDEIELKNFAGFSFLTRGSFSMFGGEDAKVWYHPGSKDAEGQLVLYVDWHRIEECRVKHFDPSEKWQRAMKRLVRDEEKALARADREKNKQEVAAKREADKQSKIATAQHKLKVAEQRVQEEAKRLGFES